MKKFRGMGIYRLSMSIYSPDNTKAVTIGAFFSVPYNTEKGAIS